MRRGGAGEYVRSLRESLEPEAVGPALAKMVMIAIGKGDMGVLKVLLPYVMGKPDEGAGGGASGVELLMAAMAGKGPWMIEGKGEGNEDSVVGDEDGAGGQGEVGGESGVWD